MLSSHQFLRIAPAIFIVVWACGFIVAKYVTPYSPPLTFLSFRYIGIVVLMTTLALYARAAFPRGKMLWHTCVAGVLMQAGYLAACWMGIAQGMPSGVMALVANLQPVLTAIFTAAVVSHTGETVTRTQWLGLLLGFAGVALVLSTKLGAASQTTFGWVAVICAVGALLSITIGTLYQKHFCPGVDPRAGQAMQSIASLIVTLPFAVLFETQPVQWTAPFWGALAFSVLVLSGMGTSLLLWLIERGAATQVTAYLYWVPPVGSLMAWFMFDERIAPAAWPGFALVALGVYWVVSVKPKQA
jgi:drug/metabolite transporter (DMT)-like permease